MRRPFLDANILFSAAYRPAAGLRRLWRLPGVELCASKYAADEARRNLDTPAQRADLDALLDQLTFVPDVVVLDHPIFQHLVLPDKDRPILLASAQGGATHLLTGDVRHFGPLYRQRVLGVLIQPPAAFMRELDANALEP